MKANLLDGVDGERVCAGNVVFDRIELGFGFDEDGSTSLLEVIGTDEFWELIGEPTESELLGEVDVEGDDDGDDESC